MSGEVSMQATGGVENAEPIFANIPVGQAVAGEQILSEELAKKFAALLEQDIVEENLEGGVNVQPEENEQEVIEDEAANAQVTATTQIWPTTAAITATLEITNSVDAGIDGDVGEEVLPKSSSQTGPAVQEIETVDVIKAADVTKGEGAKLKKVGVETMMNDFPKGWEALLDDYAIEEVTQSDSEVNAVKTGEESSAKLIQSGSTQVKGSDVQSSSFFKEENHNQQAQKNMEFDFVKTTGNQQVKTIGHEQFGMQDIHVDQIESHQSFKTSSLDSTTRSAGSVHLLNSLNEVQKQSVIKSFTQDTITGLKGQEDVLEIDLNPPGLGRVQIIIQRSGERISARLFMADAQLGEFFQEHLDQIKRTVEATGMKLGDFTLEVGQHKNSEQQELIKHKQQEQGSQNGTAGEADAKEENRKRSAGNAIKTSKVDMLI